MHLSLVCDASDAPACQACDASKALPASELQPPRPRPKTSAAVARRLIGMALNAPGLRDKVRSNQPPVAEIYLQCYVSVGIPHIIHALPVTVRSC